MFRTVPILLFIALTSPFAAFAQSNPAYTVNDVKVDIVAESSVVARNQAFSAAQTEAFKMLAARFLSEPELTTLTPPDANAIAGMVSDFEITSEQVSKRRYLGTYLFRFKAGPVNRYFGHGPIGNYDAETTTQSQLLLLPYFIQKNGKKSDYALWDVKKNPWLEAWQKQNSAKDILAIPAADISDTMDVRDPNPENLTQSAIKRIKARYNVREVTIASAIFEPSAADVLTVKLYRTDRGKVEAIRQFSVPKGDAKKLGELLSSAVPQIRQIMNGNWKNDAGYDPYAPATTDVATQGQDISVTPAVPQGSAYAPQSGQVKVVARFSNINEWLSIRKSLNDIPPLKSMLITSLTTNQAAMDFTYSDWMALTSALSARGLSLQPSGPSEYILSKAQPGSYAR